MDRRRCVTPFIGLLLLAGSGARAAAEVIPPGQEDVARRMLGAGADLPGGCRVESIGLRPTRIEAVYTCAAGRPTLELHHRHAPVQAALTTERFALVATDAPVELVTAVAGHVRAAEGGFRWAVVGERTPVGARPSEAGRPGLGVRPVPLPLTGLLFALALASGGIAVARLRPPPRDIALAGGLFATAAVLRLVLGPWGPLRINGCGPLWVQFAIGGMDAPASYGPGYRELFGPLAALRPRAPDVAIFAANAIVSAMVPALTYALVRLAGASRGIALAVAGLFAADPWTLRVGATESYYPAIHLAGALVAVLNVAARVAWTRDDRATAVLAWAGAAAAAAAGVRIHSMAWGSVVASAFAVWLLPGVDTWGARWRAAAVALGVTVMAIVVVSGPVVAAQVIDVQASQMMGPLSGGSLLPTAVAGLTALILAAAARRWALAAAVPALTAFAATALQFLQSDVWAHAYARPFLTVPVAALAASLPTAIAAVGIAAGAAWLATAIPEIGARTTEHLEYRWLRDHLAALPEGCTVVYVKAAGRRQLHLPVYPPHADSDGATSVGRVANGMVNGPDTCTYYVRGSLCSMAAARAQCDALEGRLTLQPVASVRLPARPSNDEFAYAEDTVECRLARVVSPRAAGPSP